MEADPKHVLLTVKPDYLYIASLDANTREILERQEWKSGYLIQIQMKVRIGRQRGSGAQGCG
jgi:hypothetical protein